MNPPPLTAARIVFDAEGVPHAPDFGDRYHPRIGAAAQAEHVFLHGNELPARWAQTSDFSILETGFGVGNNFLATWRAWREDPRRCDRLHYVAIEAHPPTEADLRRCLAHSDWPELAQCLVDAWPALVAGFHPIEFDHGRVRLLLAFGDIRTVTPDLDLGVDAYYFDGFAPDRNPAMWQRPVLQALAQKARPGATAATWSVARDVLDNLRAAGFETNRTRGIGGKREVTRARLSGQFHARRAPRSLSSTSAREVAIVGAGLAGAWCAHWLALDGWNVTVLDRHPGPAQETSANPGGIFHGTVHADDGPHARFNRAAALWATQAMSPWFRDGAAQGAADGLLRLAAADETLDDMRQRRTAAGLSDDYVQILEPAAASAATGLSLDRPAWMFPHGGWASPGSLVRHLLQTPGVRFLGDATVASLEHADDRWRLRDARGQPLAEAPAIVLANAAGASALWPDLAWPIGLSRGQISWWPSGPVQMPGLRLPLAGNGYALTLSDGTLLCGATASAGDVETALRSQDHAFNVDRLATLTGIRPSATQTWQGRVGWRAQTPDRLPIVGPVPSVARSSGEAPPLRCRELEHVPGLFVLTALGSRGLTWAPLAAKILASWMGGHPMPVEARLRDAVDPGRWLVRSARRAG